jgi:membrane-associated phospholipid phosphatase
VLAAASPRYKWTLALATAALQSVVYFSIGHASFPRSPLLLELPLDRVLPFWPWTVWFYLPFYAAIFIMAIAGIRSRRLFDRALVGVLVTMGIALAGHLLVRAEYPRPTLGAPRDASEAFLAWVHTFDPPGNVFPSLHVAHTMALALILGSERRRLGAVALVMAALLALSTLTTKQHFVVDVAAGLAIALAVSRWVTARPAT